MQEIIDILMGDITIAGYDLPVIVLVFVALLTISITTKDSSWGIFGTFLIFFFHLFMPALSRF